MDLWDRAAHGARRRAVLGELLNAKPASVLVVCQGNLCRSPYAEAALKRGLVAAGSPIQVGSAGFSIPNRAPPSEAVLAAAARGIDIAAHRSRSVSKALLDAADIVFVMDTWLLR